MRVSLANHRIEAGSTVTGERREGGPPNSNSGESYEVVVHPQRPRSESVTTLNNNVEEI